MPKVGRYVLSNTNVQSIGKDGKVEEQGTVSKVVQRCLHDLPTTDAKQPGCPVCERVD